MIALKTIIHESVTYERMVGCNEKREDDYVAQFGYCNIRCVRFRQSSFDEDSNWRIELNVSGEEDDRCESISIRAFISGCSVCFINASIADFLMYTEIATGE